MINVEARHAIPEGQVAATESVVGAVFPEPFRAWLRDTGGGEVAPEVVLPEPDGGNSILMEFLEPQEIAAHFGTGFAASVPRRYVVIGDGAGGAVAICVEGDERGHLYFADYDKAIQLWDEGVLEREDEPTEQIMIELASGWEEFLASR